MHGKSNCHLCIVLTINDIISRMNLVEINISKTSITYYILEMSMFDNMIDSWNVFTNYSSSIFSEYNINLLALAS